MEPRARASRHKSTLNFGEDLRQVLIAYGAPTHPDLTSPYPDSAAYLHNIPNSTANTTHRPTLYSNSASSAPNPYPETLRVLDEILTDFIIETCHDAVRHATLIGRQKVNHLDFEFVIRRDKAKMGRVQDLVRRNKNLKKERQIVDGNAEKTGRLDEGYMAGLAGLAGEDTGTGKGRGRGRGKRRKRREMEEAIAREMERREKGDQGEEGVGEDDLVEEGEGEEERPSKRARSDAG